MQASGAYPPRQGRWRRRRQAAAAHGNATLAVGGGAQRPSPQQPHAITLCERLGAVHRIICMSRSYVNIC